MATTAWLPEDARVFQYGFLCSRTSEALQEYLSTGTVSGALMHVLRDAIALIDNIITGQSLPGQKDAAAPSEAALDAYGCALEVILAHRADFEVNDAPQLAALFGTVHETLQRLLRRETPSLADVARARMFFRQFARHMLAQVSVPEESPILG